MSDWRASLEIERFIEGPLPLPGRAGHLFRESRPFLKMHGLGNDFIIVDGRDHGFVPDTAFTRAVCDRHSGIGGDQLLVIEAPTVPHADARMRIYNVDGTEAETCLNATRCVAWLVLREGARDEIRLETLGGVIGCRLSAHDRVSLRLAPARWNWSDIPLAEPRTSSILDISSGPLRDPTAVNLGNPHLVCFVADRDAIDVPRWAPSLQGHPLLPQGANVGVAEMVDPDRIKLVVWERPGILTRACGSGACAAVVAARSRNFTQQTRITVEMPGGSLEIEVVDDGLVLTGDVALAFAGFVLLQT